MRNIADNVKLKSIVVNLAQAAATYDLTTATGDVFVEDFTIRVTTAGATFTSDAIATNDTTAWELMTAAEGAVANLVAGKNMATANKGKSFILKSGKKIQHTIVGTTGTGALELVLKWRPLTGGASLS